MIDATKNVEIVNDNPLAYQRKRSVSFVDIQNEEEVMKGAAVRFRQFKRHFQNTTKFKHICTQFDILTIVLTYDSKYAIALLMHLEDKYMIRVYGLETDQEYGEFTIEGTRIKAKDI